MAIQFLVYFAAFRPLLAKKTILSCFFADNPFSEGGEYPCLPNFDRAEATWK
jgi:hypothetical protein